MIYGTRSDPTDVSTVFILFFILLGLILMPFAWCARAVGIMDPESPPSMDEVRGYTCDLRTEALCIKRRKQMQEHPEWYK